MTYEELEAEIGPLYLMAKAWMEEDDQYLDPPDGGGWDQMVDYPGGIETHALQNLPEDGDS